MLFRRRSTSHARNPDCLEGLIWSAFAWLALWTLTSQAIVFLGLSLVWALAALPFTLVLTMVGTKRLWATPRRRATARRAPYLADRPLDVPNLWAAAGAAALVIGCVYLFIVTSHWGFFWAAVAAGALPALFRPARLRAARSAGAVGRVEIELLVAFALVLLVYLFSHRPDGDDSNYVNLAIGMQRFEGPLLAVDTMLGNGPHPIHLPTYRVESLPLLTAVLAYLSPLDTIQVAHFLLPVLFIGLFCGVTCVILRPILKSDWLVALLALLALQLVSGSTLGSWGIHGVARFFQGKALLLNMIVPMLALCGYRIVRHGRMSDVKAAAALQIAGVGLSANGLFLGPLALGVASLATFALAPARPRAARRLVFGVAAASAYPLALGLSLFVTGTALPSEVMTQPTAGESLLFVSGYDIVALCILVAIPLCWMAVPRSAGRRWTMIYLAVATVILLNPLLWPLYAKATGNLGFRVFWAIPILHLLAATFAMALMAVVPHLLARITLAAALLIPAMLAAEARPEPLRVSWQLPDLKVERADYDRARRLSAMTPAGCAVLAPPPIARWLPMFEDHAFPVAVSILYLIHYRFTMPQEELSARTDLFDLVAGAQNPASRSQLVRDARELRVGVLASSADNPRLAEVVAVAGALGMNASRRDGDLLIWTRQPNEGACGSIEEQEPRKPIAGSILPPAPADGEVLW